MIPLHIENLTSAELGRLDLSEAVGLIPCGALEQHGPHLPIGTDSIIARQLAHDVASALGSPALITPVVYLGLSSHHLGFPGTFDLPPAAFIHYVRASVRGLQDLGLTRIAIFSSHGGNFGALETLAAEYRQEGERSVIAYHDFRRYLEVMVTAASSTGLDVPETDVHAGGLETSQMLYLWRRGRVDHEHLPSGYETPESGWLDRVFSDGVKTTSANGVLGRPAGASAQAGQAICRALTDELAHWAREAWAATEPA